MGMNDDMRINETPAGSLAIVSGDYSKGTYRVHATKLDSEIEWYLWDETMTVSDCKRIASKLPHHHICG